MTLEHIAMRIHSSLKESCNPIPKAKVRAILGHMVEACIDELAETGKLKLGRAFSARVRDVKPRTYMVPQTKALMSTKAKRSVKFSSGQYLLDRIQK